MGNSLGRRGVAQRLITLFVLVAFIPLLLLAGLIRYQLSSEKSAQLDKELSQSAKLYTSETHSRLGIAVNQLGFIANTMASDSARRPEADLDIFKSIEVNAEPLAAISNQNGIADSYRFTARPRSSSAEAEQILIALPISQATGRWLTAELSHQFLFETAENSEDDLCLYIDLNAAPVYCRFGAPNLSAEDLQSVQADNAIAGYIHTRQGRYAAYWTLYDSPHTNGLPLTGVIVASDAQLASSLDQFESTLLQVMALTLLVIAIVSLRAIRATMHPLKILTKATADLSNEEFSQPIRLASGDEFEHLGDRFNEMSSKITGQLRFQRCLSELSRDLQLADSVADCHRAVADALVEFMQVDRVLVLVEGAEQVEKLNQIWRHEDRELVDVNDLLTPALEEPILWTDDEIATEINLTLPIGRYLVIPAINDGAASLIVAHTEATRLEPTQIEFCRQLSNLHATSVRNQRLALQLDHQAHHDYLTGLPNRLALRKAIDADLAELENPQITVAIFDIDRFKLINDTRGHAAGDDLLIQVAQRLSENLAPGVLGSRFAGDEFIVVESFSGNPPARPDIMKRILLPILKVFQTPFEIENSKIRIHASIGIACYPKDGKTFTSLLKNADLAMYDAKKNSPGGFAFNSIELQQAIAQRYEIEVALNSVIQSGNLQLHFQPIVSLETRRTIGAEALIRWSKPEGGFVFPDVFIPIAEETGQIIELGDWILNEACGAMKRALDQGIELSVMAVNISGVQLEEPNFVTYVQRALDNTGLPANKLELEITETSLVGNMDTTIKKLERLRDMGIRVSIDDFGTGYSSLQYLRHLPVDKLKIDQSFVRGLPDSKDDLSIIRSIATLSGELNLSLLAEGCETAEQADLLQSEGVPVVQGWLFSKALPEDEFLAYASLPDASAENKDAGQIETALPER